MKAISPVIPGYEQHEVRYGEKQEEYLTLPALNCEGGIVLSRWRLSPWERFVVLLFGNVYLYAMPCGGPLQPVLLATKRPDVEEEVGGVTSRIDSAHSQERAELSSDFEKFGGPLGYQTEKTH